MVEVAMKERPTEVDTLLDFNKADPTAVKDGGGVEVDLDADPNQPSQEDDFTVVDAESADESSESLPEETNADSIPEKPYKPKKKKDVPPGVKKLLYEKNSYKNAAYSLLEETKALKREKERLEKAANAWQEDSLKIRADVAKNLYMQAVEEGDPEKQAEAQRFMIQYETELKDQQRRPKNNSQATYDEDVYDYVGEVSPPSALDEFLLENEWMDHSSPYYDPDKADLAIEFEKDLLRAMRQQGVLHLKDSKEYYDAIANHVEEAMGGSYGYKYHQQEIDPEEVEEDDIPRVQSRQSNGAQRVAPVSRLNTAQTYSNNPPKSDSRKVHLTEDERRFALSLDLGTPLSDEEKIRRFAASKRARNN